ncbi:hypothetical protein QQ045_009455 [Rhodiola kirilowii]
MAAKAQKGLQFRRKLSLLRNITGSKSVTERGIILDSISHITSLMHQIESMKKHLLKEHQAVRVEKDGKGFLVNVTCEKNGNSNLVITSVLQVFHDLNLSVTQASIDCQCRISMKASVVADDDDDLCLTVQDLTQPLTKAILDN